MYVSLIGAALLHGAAAATLGLSYDKNTGKPVTADTSSANVVGSYTPTSEGWYFLDISHSPVTSVEEKIQTMHMIGFMEGNLTCNEIKTFYPNFFSDVFGDEAPPAEVVDFMDTNYKWVSEQADAHYKTDEFWLTMKGVLEQVNGMVEGYASSPCASKGAKTDPSDLTTADNLSLMHLLMMNGWGDLYTIQTKFMLEKKSARMMEKEYTEENGYGGKARRLKYPAPKSMKLRTNATHTDIPRDLRCSSLFKLADDNSDVFFAHNTWDSFTASGPRMIKHYTLPGLSSVDDSPTRDVYFSSSPGLVTSVDDYYTAYSDSTMLAVIETTNDIMVPDLFKLVVPQSCLSWMRVFASNAVAVDGPTWASTFSREASGTYTNQWQVGDLNKFTAGSPPEAGFFTVTEEIPGKIHSEDMTDFLVEHKYWPSYNVPYFEDIYHESGNAAACKAGKKTGSTDFCYHECSRALIFKDHHQMVKDLPSMRSMISYNHYTSDPASQDDPCASIACRRDLSEGQSSYPAGAIDGKASSALTVKETVTKARSGDSTGPMLYARLGPTHEDIEPFCWSNQSEEYVHNGQPDCFLYNWLAFPPQE